MNDAGGVSVAVRGVREVERRAERVRNMRREPGVECFAPHTEMAQSRPKVGSFDQLEREV